MTLQNRGTYKDKIMLYVPPEKKNVIEEAQKIAKREGESLSQKFVKFCENYVQKHAHGNPQTLLPTFIGAVHYKCFGCGGMFKTLTKVKFISGMIGGLCPSCREGYERRQLIKKVLGNVGRAGGRTRNHRSNT